VILLLLGVAGLCSFILFVPYLHSLQRWSAQRTIVFDGGVITLPRRWIPGEPGHLLSIRKPPTFLLLPYESTVSVDPFANKWRADKLANARELWLHLNGSPAESKFQVEMEGGSDGFGAGMACVSPTPEAARHYVRIYCLSKDSVLSLEFFGDRSAIPDFAYVTSQIGGTPKSRF
jgi:hypothetical protein